MPCKFGAAEQDFLRDINPGGDKESTGLVTRFTMTEPAGVTNEFPVHVRLLSETELVKIFTNSYFADCKHREGVTDETAAEIQQALEKLRARAGNGGGAITLDDMEDLREYVRNSFGGMARASELERVYWNEAITMAPKLSVDDRARLFGIIWDNIPEFTDMFRSLATDLEKMGNPEEAFFGMDALIPREASIIDVDTLGRTDFAGINDRDGRPVVATLKVRTANGKITEISRKNATAIVAELTLVLKNSPAPYFAHTDLLDFPGYKARLDCADIAQYLKEGKEDSKVEQFFRRGKVAYLFQRYNAERELTSLLLCVAVPDNTPGLPAAVEEWIITTHGKTPQDRIQTKNALFYILTKSDLHFTKKGGADPKTHWDNIILGRFVNHFGGVHSQTTKWVEEWEPGKPFNNLFMLRNINIEWNMLNFVKENGINKENGVSASNQEHFDTMKVNFNESRLAKKHFKFPETSFNELMKNNDGGIGLIKRSLEPLCEPDLKLGQIANELIKAQENLRGTLAPFYSSGNQQDELNKKMVLLGNFGKQLKNPAFRERFPELLNQFKIAPEQLFYMYRDAERMFEEYRETAFAQPVDEGEDANMAADEPVPDLDDVLGIFDEPAPDETGDRTAAADGNMDEAHFYAMRIIDAWSARMRDLASTPECVGYYCLPPSLLLGMLDEFDVAVARLNINDRLEKKFREIAEPVDVPRESKIRKQASYAIGVLNDFVSWLGKNPAEISESQRYVVKKDERVTVFKSRPPIKDFPVLSESASSHAGDWHRDWVLAFYGMMVDNVTFDGGVRVNLEENNRIGQIIEQVNGARVS